MIDDFPQVEREVAEVASRLSEMKGRLAENLKRIKTDYKAPTLKAARKLVRKQQSERQAVAERYAAVFAAYKKALRACQEQLDGTEE